MIADHRKTDGLTNETRVGSLVAIRESLLNRRPDPLRQSNAGGLPYKQILIPQRELAQQSPHPGRAQQRSGFNSAQPNLRIDA